MELLAVIVAGRLLVSWQLMPVIDRSNANEVLLVTNLVVAIVADCNNYLIIEFLLIFSCNMPSQEIYCLVDS